MCSRPPYRIYMAGMVFHFITNEQITTWMSILLEHAEDRKMTYDTVVYDTIQVIIELNNEKTPEADAEAAVLSRTLACIARTHGAIYDPHQEILPISRAMAEQFSV